MAKKYPAELRVNIDEDLDLALMALAAKRKESKADVVRRLLREGIGKEAAADGLDTISLFLRKIIRNELKPVEERMAKLTAKTAIAAGTSMYLNYFVIKEAPLELPINPKEIYEQARVKAVAYIKERETIEVDK